MSIISMLISLFTFYWLIQSIYAHRKPHVCQHDNDELTRNLPPEYFETIKDMDLDRKLGGSDPQPLRVTLDFSYLDDTSNGMGMDTTIKEYIKKIMFASKLFLQNFIKVIPRSQPIIRRYFSTCIDINVSESLKTTGVSNSDLHILVTYENNPKSGGLANAGACEYDMGPVIGRVKFNIGTMQNIGTSPEGFDGDFSTAIHEITHILGFSGGAMQYWIDPDTGKPYLTDVQKIQVKESVRGVNDVIKLKSKNVLETARRYFNCPSLQSFALENQGGSGSFGSHWERDLLQNEYMTASAVTGRAVISQFTAALLMDTGFYAEINSNMVEKMFWGEGQGCDFVEKACSSATQFPEFSPNQDIRCDFHYMGYGELATDQFSQCNITQSYSNTKCYDDKTCKPDQIRRNNPGPGSKCFASNALDSRYIPETGNDFRCHKYTCNADNTIIDVGLWKDEANGIDIKAKCTAPKQIINLTGVSQNTQGTLTCPNNFELFCSFPKYCNNFCFGNGICQNGVCYCLEGYVSSDCSKTCPIPQVWDGTKCILECTGGTFLNPDRTCKATCPPAYYGNSTSKTCDLCEKTCSVCTGPTNKECSKCNDPYKLSGNSCVDPSKTIITCDSSCLTCFGTANNQCSSCSDEKFLDSNKMCQLCMSPCKTCKDKSIKCNSCISADYSYDSSGFTCKPICDASCITCSAPKDATKCLTCFDGKFLSNGQCQACKTPCTKCIDKEDKCTDCIANYKFDSTKNTCNITCDNTCLTCSAPLDNTQCLTCKDGQYISSGKCLQCSSPCSKCNKQATTCTDCVTDYTINSGTNTCQPNCDVSCKTCSAPKNPQKCFSCNSGFYLDKITFECKKCTSPCATCVDSAVNCLSCISSIDYILDSTNSVCNMVCDLQCKTCTKPKDQAACSSCKDGNYIDTNSCKNCAFPCKTCQTSSTNCISCEINYTLTINSCAPSCHSSCKTCTKPVDQNSCTSCYDGLFLDGTQCTKCAPPCQNCVSNSSKCTSCISSDYTLDISKNLCNSICDASCKTCSKPKDASSCQACFDGAYISSGSCLKCKSPCSSCEISDTKCLSCISNYSYDSSKNTCNPNCDSSCKTCTKPVDPNSCSSCYDGSFLDGIKCQKCTSPCLTCDNSTKCNSCISQDYKFDNITNKCSSICDSTCKTCSLPKDAFKCLDCVDGSFLSNGQCKKCKDPCGTCIESESKCLTCLQTDKYSINLTTNTCVPVCDPFCKQCSEPKNPNKCTDCKEGMFLNFGQCLACKSPCKNCVDRESKCTSCISIDYTYNQTKNICELVCDTSCKTCIAPVDPTKCTNCVDGKFLDNGTCKPCNSPCASCDLKETKCITCLANYNINQTTNTCDAQCDSSCKTCSAPKDPLKCLSCIDTSYLNAQSSCQKCEEPCVKCETNSKKCLSCSSNYSFNSSNNTCEPICNPVCKTCKNSNDSNSCLSCKDGSFLDGSTCSPCLTPCKTCQDNPSKCILCISEINYTLDLINNKCMPVCDSACQTCTEPMNPLKFTSCIDGSYLENNQCKKCKAPCQNCITATKCLSCFDDKYKFDSTTNQCKSTCHDTCKSCTQPYDATKCDSCFENFYLDGSSCKECAFPCSNCEISNIKCLSCEAGYLYNSSYKTCEIICDKSCKTCQSKDANSCLSCYEGSFLDGTKCTKCTSPCGTCIDTSTKCLSCVNIEYTYNSSKNICEPVCEAPCKTCSSPKDVSKCLTCNDGNYFESGHCNNCQPPCKTCVDNATKCLSCINSNYNFDVSKNKCIIQCHTSCKTCSVPNNESKCDSCFNGFFQDGTKCSNCQTPCSTCIDSSTKCLSCSSSDYILDSIKNICNFVCDASCKTCSAPKDSSKCTVCQDAPCATCKNTNSFCLTCETGYSLDQINAGKCNAICHSSCTTCSKPNDLNACLTCKEGYFLKANQCLPCISSCSKCVDFNDKCTQCTTDFTLNKMSSTCSPICDSSCKTCSEPKNPQKCLTCKDTSYLFQNECQKCQQPCLNCKDTATKCLSCISNDFIYDTVQFKCLSNCHTSCKSCSTPSSDMSCTSCFDGFYLDGNQCKSCEAPCQTCSNAKDSCKTCIFGYLLQTDKCKISCDSACRTCTNSNDPSSCDCNQTDKKCIDCEDKNCSNCDQNLKKCNLCKEGFTLNPSTFQCVLNEYIVYPSTFTIEEVEEVAKIAQATSLTATICSTILSLSLNIISQSSFGILMTGLSCQKFSYTILVENNLPQQTYFLQKAVSTQIPSQQMESLNFFPIMLESEQSSSKEYNSGKFEKINLKYNLLYSCGQGISLFLICSVLTIIFYIGIERAENQKIVQLSQTLYSKLFCGFIVQYFQLIISMFSIGINSQILEFYVEQNIEFLELKIIIMLALTGLIILIFQRLYYYLNFQQTQKNNLTFAEIIREKIQNGTIFESKIRKNFMLIYIFIESIVVPTIFIQFRFSYLTASILAIMLQTSQVILISILLPFISKITNIFFIIDSVLWLFFYIYYLIQNIYSAKENLEDNANILDKTSWLLIVTLHLILLVNIVYLALKVILKLIKLIKEQKVKKQQHVSEFLTTQQRKQEMSSIFISKNNLTIQSSFRDSFSIRTANFTKAKKKERLNNLHNYNNNKL